MKPKEKVVIELTESETLVLFEFLTRFSKQEKLEIADPSESKVLWDIQCILEEKLAAPFKANYAEILSKAQADVRGSGKPE